MRIGSICLGKYDEKREITEQLRDYLKEQMIKHKILNGFVDVLVANDVYEGINSLMQTTGVGGFRPNTVKRQKLAHSSRATLSNLRQSKRNPHYSYANHLLLFLGDVR